MTGSQNLGGPQNMGGMPQMGGIAQGMHPDNYGNMQRVPQTMAGNGVGMGLHSGMHQGGLMSQQQGGMPPVSSHLQGMGHGMPPGSGMPQGSGMAPGPHGQLHGHPSTSPSPISPHNMQPPQTQGMPYERQPILSTISNQMGFQTGNPNSNLGLGGPPGLVTSAGVPVVTSPVRIDNSSEDSEDSVPLAQVRP